MSRNVFDANASTALYVDIKRNCSSDSDEFCCCRQLLGTARFINNRLWADYKKSEENLIGADIYTTVILGLFASIITLLLVRSVKSRESLDEQVTVLLSSMQLRIEHDEVTRRKKSMREAKKKAQEWLSEIRRRSVNRISRRHRSTSFYSLRSRKTSGLTSGHGAFDGMPPTRTRSYNGTLPSIVVHDEVAPDPPSSTTSREVSRQSSVGSELRSVSSVDQDTVFQFPPIYVSSIYQKN
ncbi:hypothetical protein Q1695_011278 [Nippostrongylus brasiliensis]|nr:hypothetical protein Q1695_011278 [Nippostrongylus brasiliensis]